MTSYRILFYTAKQDGVRETEIQASNATDAVATLLSWNPAVKLTIIAVQVTKRKG